MKITLLEWASSYFGETKPSLRTMRRWVSEGKIKPQAEKIGRTLYVDEEAVFKGQNRNLLLKQLEKSREKKSKS